jgi:acyl carrier protein
MTTDHIKKIKELIVEKLGVAEPEIKEEASFEKDFGVDSLDVYELLTEIEDEFNLSISDEDADNITTVGLLFNYVNKHAGI